MNTLRSLDTIISGVVTRLCVVPTMDSAIVEAVKDELTDAERAAYGAKVAGAVAEFFDEQDAIGADFFEAVIDEMPGATDDEIAEAIHSALHSAAPMH